MRSGWPDNFLGKAWLAFCGFILLPAKWAFEDNNFTWLIITVLIITILFILFTIYPELDNDIVRELALKGWK